MKPQVHQLQEAAHHFLLDENRHDPITGEILNIGDVVVFCAGCKSVFLLDTWEYLDKKHCGQSRTLSVIPSPQHLHLRKRSVRFYKKQNYEYANFFERFWAFVVDAVLLSIIFFFGLLFSIFISFFFASIFGQYAFVLMPIWGVMMLSYALTRDGWKNGASLGKGNFSLRVIQLDTGENCTRTQAFIKMLVLPLDILALPYTAFQGITLGDVLTNTRVIRDSNYHRLRG